MALCLADGSGVGGNPGAHRVPVDDQPGGQGDVDGHVDDNVNHVDDHVDEQPGGQARCG